jgi:hypothetical protein
MSHQIDILVQAHAFQKNAANRECLDQNRPHTSIHFSNGGNPYRMQLISMADFDVRTNAWGTLDRHYNAKSVYVNR